MRYNDIIDLSGGYAFPSCLPDLTRHAATAAGAYRLETMQYSEVFGLEDLRDLIVEYVKADGVICHRDNVMIVNGAKHGLDLACRAFLSPGDRVIVTAPTYMTALNILKTHGVEFLAISQDESGILTSELEAKLAAAFAAGEPLPKLLFDVPDFHNPTGITTALDRRRELVALAERFGFFIIEDDPYRRIRFEGEAVAPIKSLDVSGVVIALGTASKIVAPGLRLGWVIADPEIVERLAQYKADGGTSPFNQRIFAELLRTNQIDSHVETLIDELRTHRDEMLDSLGRALPSATARKPSGGYFLWVEFPHEIDTQVLAGLGPRFGVKMYSGRLSFPGPPAQNALRLCYSFEEPARIRSGIERLAKACNALQTGEFDGEAKELALSISSATSTY